MALTLILVQHEHYAHRYPQLLLNLFAGIAVYGAGVLWFFLTREPAGVQLKHQLRGRVVRYFAQTSER